MWEERKTMSIYLIKITNSSGSQSPLNIYRVSRKGSGIYKLIFCSFGRKLPLKSFSPFVQKIYFNSRLFSTDFVSFWGDMYP
jgi:hypothetical protein